MHEHIHGYMHRDIIYTPRHINRGDGRETRTDRDISIEKNREKEKHAQTGRYLYTCTRYHVAQYSVHGTMSHRKKKTG